MIDDEKLAGFKKIIQKTEIQLIQFFFYVGILLYLWFRGYGWWSLLFVHALFILLYGIFYFRQQFLLFLLSPIIAFIIPISNYSLKKYLKNFKQNIPTEVVIVLGQSDFFKLEAWIKPNFFKEEIKLLIKYLGVRGQDFSFYPNASIEDVKEIMSNKEVKEVYFVGHGDSHTFQLNSGEILYYCNFNDPEKYGKEFVHQVHCGTSHGKSLVDYVIPEKNREQCFFFRRSITSLDIKKEFQGRIKEISKRKKQEERLRT